MAAVRYIVEDVDKSVAFFTETLGFKIEEHMGAPFALVSHGDLRVWLSGPGSSAQRPMPDGRQPVPGGWNRLVIEVKDLAAIVERLRASGASFRNEPLKGPGGTQVVIDDPSGNPIEIFQPA